MSQAWAAGLSCREGQGVLAGADCSLPNILRWANGRLVLAKYRKSQANRMDDVWYN